MPAVCTKQCVPFYSKFVSAIMQPDDVQLKSNKIINMMVASPTSTICFAVNEIVFKKTKFYFNENSF